MKLIGELTILHNFGLVRVAPYEGMTSDNLHNSLTDLGDQPWSGEGIVDDENLILFVWSVELLSRKRVSEGYGKAVDWVAVGCHRYHRSPDRKSTHMHTESCVDVLKGWRVTPFAVDTPKFS